MAFDPRFRRLLFGVGVVSCTGELWFRRCDVAEGAITRIGRLLIFDCLVESGCCDRWSSTRCQKFGWIHGMKTLAKNLVGKFKILVVVKLT